MRLHEALFASLLALTGVSMVIGLGVDFFCLLYGVNSMAALHDRGMTDFLRVTTVDPLLLVTARVRLARLYAWRMFFVLAAVRCVLLAILAVAAVVALAAVIGTRYDARGTAFLLGAALGGMTSATVFMLREPYWRYHAMTAIGVQQAAEHPNPFSRFVWTVLAVVGFWVVQGVVLLMGGYAVGMGGAVLFAVLLSLREIDTPIISAVVFVVMLVGSLLPLLYLLVMRQIMLDYVPGRSLRRSAKRFLGWE
jgi:hypothetical protein